MTRRVLYVTGTRADFGLMQRVLHRIDIDPALDLSLAVTGMHLSARFGSTIHDVERSGLAIAARIPVDIDDDSGLAMARAAARLGDGLADVLARVAPDWLVLLGDRWEMLAAATTATLAGIPIVHLCGGERSGTIDDAMRHAISKLAHVHAVATPDAGERLRRMGEEAHRIHVVGTPGLVGIIDDGDRSRADLFSALGLDSGQPTAIVLFHPVVQDADRAHEQGETLMTAVIDTGIQALCLLPNADPGNAAIRTAMEAACAAHPHLHAVAHLARRDYLSLLATADLLVGNSSSGIIESASFGLPTINIGDRQSGRERNANTVDCPIDRAAIADAVIAGLRMPRSSFDNVYGDGRTDTRVAALLADLPIDRSLMKKANTY